ncbi:MAG TPA: dockerin type I repeat-containing protein, partial [Rhodothermales bacterium]|nr:dockerin type I repeat-containing protein [Rhodothermales bacterium]
HHSSGDEVIFAGLSFEEWKAQGHDRNSLIADPEVRWVNGIPHVAESSPAIAIGFEPVDWSIAGLEDSQIPYSPFFDSADANGDDQVNVADIFYLINYLLSDGPAPIGSGDANDDGTVNISDVFYLINRLLSSGGASGSSTATFSSTPGESSTVVAGESIVLADGEILVPVRLAVAPGTSVTSIALGLEVAGSSRLRAISVERRGIAESSTVRFEATTSTASRAGWLISFEEPLTATGRSEEIAVVRLKFESAAGMEIPSVRIDSGMTAVDQISASPRRGRATQGRTSIPVRTQGAP